MLTFIGWTQFVACLVGCLFCKRAFKIWKELVLPGEYKFIVVTYVLSCLSFCITWLCTYSLVWSYVLFTLVGSPMGYMTCQIVSELKNQAKLSNFMLSQDENVE